MITVNNMCEKIDRLAEIKQQQEQLKHEQNIIEAELLKIAEEDLANTKYKSITYSGDKATLKAVTAESVKVTYEAFLPFIFGKAYDELCKTKTSVELTAPAKRLITGLWKGDFIRSTVADVIRAMELDKNTEKLVVKKCKGINYEKDKQNLIDIVGMKPGLAEENAYLLAEAAVWQQFSVLLELNGIDNEARISELLQKIQAAFVVEETPKINVEVK